VIGDCRDGIVITGTRGAGKTTFAGMLAVDPSVGWVTSTTTRPPRVDDRPGSFAYVGERTFARLYRSGELILVSRYGEYSYGIARGALAAVVAAGRRPLLTVAPDMAGRVWAVAADATGWHGVFVDARDDVLDARLAGAGRPAREWDRRQRILDRTHRVPPLVPLDNSGELDVTARRLCRVAGCHNAAT
jgi:guanylate kinase